MSHNNKWGFWLLTAFVVGNMVGSGIFMLPSTLAQTASPLGVTLAWMLTGFGVLMIALVFGNLSVRRPELTAGPQSYARALFRSPQTGNMAGFSMVWGYWIANASGNVAVITTFAGYLSAFFPVMKEKSILFHFFGIPMETGKFITFLVCSALLWGIHAILIRGLSGAGKLNFIATFTKVLGFALFIGAALSVFDAKNLGAWYTPVTDSDGITHNLWSQVTTAALSTLWAFVGIESAVVLSGRARSQRDVKKATIAGLVIAVIIYLAITMLTMGVLPQEVLKASDKPLVDALTFVIGNTGATLMALLAITSLLGTAIGWILLGTEAPFQGAQSGMFPAFLGKVNRHGSPIAALTATNLISQLFIFSTVSNTIAEAFQFVITIATLASLMPYLVSAVYQLKLVVTGETYRGERPGVRAGDGLVALLAVVYAVWVIKSGTSDMKTLLFGLGLFAVGLLFYPFMTRRSARTNETLPSAAAELK
ncbi:amino acid permease [Brevibacillus sp. SYP-B805]|uniref:amino acid permease n=1 Tax=Brevibacillus sp. SYP-B805 TaxID=1578199 RepID=UPI0013ED60B6|nr:amino acid permease [Brevibacillus sp. SYP-B805]NGQ96350.1 amino acid permease [Brevibacillus sp. SYP-B805]